ncbi:MAG: DUF6516 family protein [Candidatus Nanohaloarchaea archaeon]
MSEKIFEIREIMSDGKIVEAKAFHVPESDDYRKDVKYSFQYFNPKNGETILRYDNYNQHSGSMHQKHMGEETKPTEFESIEKQFIKFMREVREHVRRRKNP